MPSSASEASAIKSAVNYYMENGKNLSSNMSSESSSSSQSSPQQGGANKNLLTSASESITRAVGINTEFSPVILVLVIALILFVVYLVFFHNKNPFHTHDGGNSDEEAKNKDDIVSKMKSKNVKVMAASWCGFCKKLKTEMEQEAPVESVFVFMDKLNDEEKKKYSHLSISGYPTMVQNDDKVVGVGYMPLPKLKDLIEKL